MKKFVILLLVLAVVVVSGYLVYNGIIKWQPLTMLFAALAAPLRFIIGLFGSKEDEIRARHEKLRETEAAFQERLLTRVQERESRIAELNRQIEIIDGKLELLRLKRQAVDQQVEDMSLSELQREGQRLFGS
ncbi:hypothetical protein HUU05_23540 [candidate division KSB1 bacterium]|nr:hypothetical protein [candidate division KSB1 bacterium]